MARFLVRRCLWGVVLLVLVSAATFAIFYLLPSADPAVLRAGRGATPQTIAAVRHDLGLDRPVTAQYWHFLTQLVLHFDLGYSYTSGAPVSSLIADGLPATISLAAGAIVVWLLVGIPLGILSALRPRSWFDRLAMGGALVALSAPVYWLGLVVLYLFADDIGRWPLLPGAGSYVGLTRDPWHWLTALVLPWLVLASTFAAIYARVLRTSLIETMQEDYVRTARAKGASERVVLFRHALRNALIPVTTVAGLIAGFLVAGAVIIESVFRLPGVGQLVYDSINNRDLVVIKNVVILFTILVLIVNLLVDLAYALLDPRPRVTA
jgi:peptide/nickel transport system permease protein